MKKFYKHAEAGTAPGGYTVRLDGKNIKTPLQKPFIVPTSELAAAIAAEWQAQGDNIAHATMPLMQLASTMIDKAAMGTAERAEILAEIVKYAGSDLICYRAAYPADLVKRQQEQWQPLVEWLTATYNAPLTVLTGMQYAEQPEKSVKAIGQAVAALDPVRFTVLQALTGALGSVALALALVKGYMDAEAVYHAATVDEQYQMEKWGEDILARRKLDGLRHEIETAARFLTLSGV